MNFDGFTKIVRMILKPPLLILALIVLLIPQTRADLITTDSTSNSVTLHWTAPGDDGDNGTASAYDIRYSTSMINNGNWGSASQVDNESQPQAAGSSESFIVTGLQPNTTYYFAIKAADESNNWSPLSNVASKTTAPEEVPPADIDDLLAAEPTTNSISLSWTAPGDDGTQGQASTYDIRYATFPINDSNWGSAIQVENEPSPQVAGSSETLVIAGLSINTTYYFAIKTADDVPNWSGLSNIASGTTSDEQTPPNAITNLQITQANDDNVTLMWTAPGDDGNQGTASQYDIRYSTSPITEAGWNSALQVNGEPAPLPAGTVQTFTVSGLQQETRYYFAIKTADEVPNWSALSNVVNIVTPDQTPPSAIDDLSAITGDDIGTIMISWTAPGDDGSDGTADSYIIKASLQPITEQNWQSIAAIGDPPAPMGSGSPQNFVIAGLNPGQIYYIAIKSVDEYNNVSAISNIDSAEARPFGTDDIDVLAGLPGEYNLSQNYPNPFNPSTKIEFSLPEPADVVLEIYDSIGRKITTLLSEFCPAGYYAISWDGRCNNGSTISTGVYFYRIIAGDFAATRKMVFLK